jgi:hypothetical protein
MKKLLYLLLTLSALGFQSCLKEDEDYFDKTASARMSSTLEAYKSTLVASEYGWALEYYPDENQSYGGYVYAIKFTDDKATVAMDWFGSSLTRTSLYKFVGDDGPVLTFDSYNILLHFFANPSEDMPNGQMGDYEFILMGQKDDVITLKGKRTGNKMTLTKLKEPFNDYIDKVGTSGALIDDVPIFTFTVGSGAIAAATWERNMTFSYVEGDVEKTVSVGFIPTITGVKLYEPITIMGETFQEFKYNDDLMGMTCTTNSKVKFTFIFPPINEVMSQPAILWKFAVNGSNMCSDLASLLAAGKEAIKTKYKMTMTSFGFGANPKYPGSDQVRKFAFATIIGGYYGILGYEMAPVEGTTDQVTLELTSLGLNWSAFSALNPFVLKIASGSPYRMEADKRGKPTYVKYVSVADPTIWFRVDK